MTKPWQALSDQEFGELLLRARQGDQDALGLLIERYRPYLLKIAHHEADERIKAKEGDSDVVQDTCFKAVGVFRDFEGQTADEMRGWLRSILRTELGSQRDYFEAGKRSIRCEVPLDKVESGDSQNDKLATTAESPSVQVEKREQLAIFEKALRELREVDQQIIELRQKEACDFAEIARRLDMTEAAVQKRWWRALEALKEKVKRLQ